mmetsp:Transcript_92729/g.300008  ORF Transcript_92729/g.300008 Transcript_92729/m.300008 type:complete len:222 (-) Transcript_92729:3066-3731(-)
MLLADVPRELHPEAGSEGQPQPIRSRKLADLGQLLGRVVLHLELGGEAPPEAGIGVHEQIHFVGVACENNEQACAVILDLGKQRPDDLAAELVAAPVCECVRLVNKEAATHRIPHGLDDGWGRLPNELTLQSQCVPLHEGVSRQDAVGVEIPANESCNGRLARARVAHEPQVEARLQNPRIPAPLDKGHGAGHLLEEGLDVRHAGEPLDLQLDTRTHLGVP